MGHPADVHLFICLVSIIWCPCKVLSVPIDNGVEVEPQIVCGSGFISATFLLRNNFDGHVFVKNHYNETGCRSDQTGKRAASISVPFSTCGVQRTRSLNPKGVFFITKVDRAYAFQCFYMESEKTVTAQLDISELTSVFQTQRVPMPVCRYEVLDAQPPNGQPIRYSIVGQQVFHRWVCETETTNTFCMNINSCFVYDGLGDQAQLLDANGCAVDRYLLQNLEYTSDLSAFREAHVFKFADRNAVYFQCQISITVKEPNSICPRSTCPPAPAGTVSPTNGAPGTNTKSTVGDGGGQNEGSTQTPTFAPTPVPFPTTTALILPRTTSNASYRAFTIADDPVNLDEFRPNPNSSLFLGRHRKHRSVIQPPMTPSAGQELGVWDVRVPSIAVFDMEDGNALGLTKNRSGVVNDANVIRNRYFDLNSDRQDYCLTLPSFALLLAMSITPTLGLITACFMRCMQRRSSKFY